MSDEDRPKSMHYEEQATPTSGRAQFRRHAVDFEAVQFTGNNWDELQAFCGTREFVNEQKQVFGPFGQNLHWVYEDKEHEPTGELWVEDDQQWTAVEIGDWVVPQEEGFVRCTDEWIQINCVQLDEEMLALIREDERPKTFHEDLVRLLNHHSQENASGTPDWILAEYLMASLRAYELAVGLRANWRGESVELPALQSLRRGAEETERLVEMIKKLVAGGIIHIERELTKTDLYREMMDYQAPEPTDLEQGGLEAGDTQGPDKEVPLVIYTDGQRNEIGTAKIHVTPGEVQAAGTITSAIPQFADPAAAYSVEEKEEEPEPEPRGAFERYIRKGLTDGG